MFGYLKLLVPNGEGEKSNISVGYLGCGTELQQDRGYFCPHVIFSVLLGFLDCLHPPPVAARRVKSGPKRSWSDQSCIIRNNQA